MILIRIIILSIKFIVRKDIAESIEFRLEKLQIGPEVVLAYFIFKICIAFRLFVDHPLPLARTVNYMVDVKNKRTVVQT